MGFALVGTYTLHVCAGPGTCPSKQNGARDAPKLQSRIDEGTASQRDVYQSHAPTSLTKLQAG